MPVQSEWSLSAPRKFTFEEPVTALAVQIVSGVVNIVGTDSGPAALEVSEIDGPPLIVTHEAGTLTVTYEDLPWKNFLKWAARKKWNRTVTVTLTVPVSTRVEVGSVDASAVVSGIAGRTVVRGVAGDTTLVGLTGDVRAETVSGRTETQGLGGALRFNSVSGDLTLIEAAGDTVRADSVSGNIVVDLSAAAKAPELTLGAVSGDIALRLPRRANLAVDATTAIGLVSCAFEELRVDGMLGGRRVTGRLGAGGGTLKVTTVSGAVALLHRPETEGEVL
ncbi:DUF4097 family beta strand repeat-containing protein [Streptomyces sp. ISL-11]|uniref:DUF4097 family beta strand repeat-containing protein n=1 Tax=Streptomyces sp. ISL-11 TaxID=2819174 RepID=UPI001BEA1EA8|nr:DUF4097 family beta strand repeat-containing protein [Streptomyces sp. ISL-11]MBT2384624.1 DUF4097 family beta strand repeat protein [Streptomyces sp. ISL-11]